MSNSSMISWYDSSMPSVSKLSVRTSLHIATNFTTAYKTATAGIASKRTGFTMVTIPATKAKAVIAMNVNVDFETEKVFWFGVVRLIVFMS